MDTGAEADVIPMGRRAPAPASPTAGKGARGTETPKGISERVFASVKHLWRGTSLLSSDTYVRSENAVRQFIVKPLTRMT